MDGGHNEAVSQAEESNDSTLCGTNETTFALEDLVPLLLSAESNEDVVNLLNKSNYFKKRQISPREEAFFYPLTCSGEQNVKINYGYDHINYLKWTLLSYVNYGNVLKAKYDVVAPYIVENRGIPNNYWQHRIPKIGSAEAIFHKPGWDVFFSDGLRVITDEDTWNMVGVINELLKETLQSSSYLLTSTRCRSQQELEKTNPWDLRFEDHYAALSAKKFFEDERRKFEKLKEENLKKFQGVTHMPEDIRNRLTGYTYEGAFNTRMISFMSRIPLPPANATLSNGENIWNTFDFIYARFGRKQANYNPGLISEEFAHGLVNQAGAATWKLWDFFVHDSFLSAEDRESLKQFCLRLFLHHTEVTSMLFHFRATFKTSRDVSYYELQVRFTADVQECLNNPVELEKLVNARKQNHPDLADKPSCILMHMILLFQSAFHRDKLFYVYLETVKPSNAFIIKVLRDLKVIEIAYTELPKLKEKVAFRLSHLYSLYLPFGLGNDSFENKKSIGEMIVDLFHAELFDVLLEDAYERGRRFMIMDSFWIFHSFLMTSSLKEYQERFANESFAFVFLTPTTKGAFVKGFDCNLNPIVLDFPVSSSNPTQYVLLPEHLSLEEVNESSINHQAFRDSVKRLVDDKKFTKVVFTIIVNENEISRKVNMLLQQTINQLPVQLKNFKNNMKHALVPINEAMFTPLLRTRLIREAIPDDGQMQEPEILEARRKMELLRLAVRDKTAFLANYLAEDDEDWSENGDETVFCLAPLHPWKDLLGVSLMKSQFCTLLKLAISYKRVSMDQLLSGGFEIEKANIILSRFGARKRYFKVITDVLRLFSPEQRREFEELSKEEILIKLGLNDWEMFQSYHFFEKDFGNFTQDSHRLERGFVDFLNFKKTIKALVPDAVSRNADVLRQTELMIQAHLDQGNLDTIRCVRMTARLTNQEVRVYNPAWIHHPKYDYAVISSSAYWNYPLSKFGLDHLFLAKEDIKAAQVFFGLVFQELDTTNAESFAIPNYVLLNLLQKCIVLYVYYMQHEDTQEVYKMLKLPLKKPKNTVILRPTSPFTSIDDLLLFGFCIYPWRADSSRSDRVSCQKLETVTVTRITETWYYYFPKNQFALPSDIQQFVKHNEEVFKNRADDLRTALEVGDIGLEHVLVARSPNNADTPTHLEATDSYVEIDPIFDMHPETMYDFFGVLL